MTLDTYLLHLKTERFRKIKNEKIEWVIRICLQ